MPSFEVQPIPGKGKGLIAIRRITMGTRILIESPLLQSNNAPPASLEPILARKLKALTKEQQRQFLSLHNNFPGKYPFSGIMETNALPCWNGEASGGAVYPIICLINHSCNANAHSSWNEALEQQTIHATRDIAPGEEITISYGDADLFARRKTWLRENFGFDCNCSVCLLPPAELEKSDRRRELIQQLDTRIGDLFCMMSRPNVSLANCRLLLQVLKEEFANGTTPLLANAYNDAFLVVIRHGDVARGAIFAERAYQIRIICYGGDHPETQMIQRLAEDPKIDKGFAAYSKRWTTEKGEIPQELKGDEFEKWLWRQE
ncbi:hypothetical protein FPOAC1_012640 [Fusarium poae]|jgi:hypothetical protein|uniref:hypothetical protein n=1 Tax=Fusarium poae TaxID=36050 RepID=UPI001CE8DBDC|nr:hypothetical protein FPOAC1_012640 [Fusarium poae]KAG8667801.1 hypothetical protein FPOAC1_012640 [Fusarium poae]